MDEQTAMIAASWKSAAAADVSAVAATIAVGIAFDVAVKISSKSQILM